jgi:hypothetical protein
MLLDNSLLHAVLDTAGFWVCFGTTSENNHYGKFWDWARKAAGYKLGSPPSHTRCRKLTALLYDIMALMSQLRYMSKLKKKRNEWTSHG